MIWLRELMRQLCAHRFFGMTGLFIACGIIFEAVTWPKIPTQAKSRGTFLAEYAPTAAFFFGRSGETCEHFSLAGDAKNQRILQCAHWLMHRPPACAITHSSLATVKQKQGAFAPCFCLVGVARLASIFRLRETRKIKEFASVCTGSCTGHRPVRLHIQVSPQ